MFLLTPPYAATRPAAPGRAGAGAALPRAWDLPRAGFTFCFSSVYSVPFLDYSSFYFYFSIFLYVFKIYFVQPKLGLFLPQYQQDAS